MSDEKPKSDTILLVIAIYKMVSAVLFFAAGVGILHFLNRDVAGWLRTVLENSHVDEGNHLVRHLLRAAGSLTNTRLESISAVCFVYGTLFGIEGVGLYLKKRWAEYLVVILTGSLLPLEIYELWLSISVGKMLLLMGNLLIIGYLISVIIRNEKRRKPE